MKQYFLVFLFIFLTDLSYASNLKYEAGLKYSFFSYSDNEGAANLESAFTPTLKASYKLSGRGQRTSINLDYYSTSGKASSTKTGQNAEGYGITAKYHYQLNLSRSFQDLWVSAGGKFSQVDFDSRHTVDSDGYLIKKIPNQTISTSALSLSINKIIFLGSRRSNAINVGLFFDQPLGNGISEYGIVANFHF